MTNIAFYVSPEGDVFLQYSENNNCSLMAEFRSEVPSHHTLQTSFVDGCDAEMALSAVAKHLWEKFADVPVADDGKLLAAFEHFAEGADRDTVYHWFENELNACVHDLMFPGSLSDNGRS